MCLHLYSFIHDHACWRFISPFIGVCCQYLFQSRYIQLSFLVLFFLNIIQLFTFQAFSQWRCVQRFLPWALFAMRTHTSGQLRIRYDMPSNVKVGRQLYLCESSFGRFSFIWYTNLERRNVLQKIRVYSRQFMWTYCLQERLEHYGLHSCHIWVRWLFLSWLFKGTCMYKTIGMPYISTVNNYFLFETWTNMCTYWYIFTNKTSCSRSFNPMA